MDFGDGEDLSFIKILRKRTQLGNGVLLGHNGLTCLEFNSALHVVKSLE